jgi:hypothetical protein
VLEGRDVEVAIFDLIEEPGGFTAFHARHVTPPEQG